MNTLERLEQDYEKETGESPIVVSCVQGSLYLYAYSTQFVYWLVRKFENKEQICGILEESREYQGK